MLASQMLTTIIAFYVFPRIIIQYNINVHPLYFTHPQINDFITFQETETRHHWATANSHKADCSSSFLIFLEKLCYLLCDTHVTDRKITLFQALLCQHRNENV